MKRFKGSETQGLCSENMHSCNARSYHYKLSLTCLSKHELNQDDKNSPTNVDGGQSPLGLNPTHELQETKGLSK